MPSPLTDAILDLAEQAGAAGIAMGTIVDTLEPRGFVAEHVEREIWSLLERRRLTPNGFVCRTFRRHSPDGAATRARVYEFVLVPWSAALDHQLDLGLEAGR
ncbi:MAG: hypothetical protein IAG13_00865 [Deltaproteobacteria bacterium]|nr:hypothetical protein [Nannocystaceae bacterium]